MISPTGGVIGSGNGRGYARFSYSLPYNAPKTKTDKSDFQMLKQPIKSAVTRLVKLISASNKDVKFDNLNIKLEDAPSGFITMFTKRRKS
jgi:hypothetical protein